MTTETLKNSFRDALRQPHVRRMGVAMLVGTGALVLAIAFWWPTRISVSALNQEITEIRRLVQEKRASVELAEATRRAAMQTQQAEKKLVQETLQASLVRELELLARRHAVRVMSSSYDESKPQDSFVALVHELTVQGSYQGVRAFLLDLPSLPTFTILEEASIARASERGAGLLKATFQFRTWRRLSAAQERRP